jgi:hypothetical protein
MWALEARSVQTDGVVRMNGVPSIAVCSGTVARLDFHNTTTDMFGPALIRLRMMDPDNLPRFRIPFHSSMAGVNRFIGLSFEAGKP